MNLEKGHARDGFESRSGLLSGKRVYSKTGCITCKVRKKRCAEQRPVCWDCARLNLECVYSDHLTREQVKECKVRLRKAMSEKKVRGNGNGIGKQNYDDAFKLMEVGFDGGSLEMDQFRTELCSSDKVRKAVWSSKLNKERKTSFDVSDIVLDIDINSLFHDLNASTDNSFHRSEDHPITSLDDELERSTNNSVSLSRTESEKGSGRCLPIYSWQQDPYLSQPLIEPTLHDLEPADLHLYNYYRQHLAKIICIAPTKQNFYLQCFLPMAHRHKGILYGILAWSAHHISISNTSIFNKDHCDNHKLLNGDMYYSRIANRYIYYSLQYLQEIQEERLTQNRGTSFLYSLAQILILCGAEICQGDVNRWQILLKTGARLIKDHLGGSNLTSILRNTESSISNSLNLLTRNWLLANFIYHDIMGSQRTMFPMQQYETLLLASNHNFFDWKLNLDSLHGLNRPVFKLLGDTTNLIRQMKSKKLTHKNDEFNQLISGALEINQQLLTISPNEKELMVLSNCVNEMDDGDVIDGTHSYCELSENLFEAFRLSALIHLKTTVLKVDKNTFEILFYTNALMEKLDMVLGTRLEASLCFPMFICGINCIDSDREVIEAKFVDYINRYKCRNVVRAHEIMHKVWKMDDEGESLNSFGIRERDWLDICDDIGWDISFA